MTGRRAALAVRMGVLAGLVLLLEALCRTEVIDPLTVIPPSDMVASMAVQLRSPEIIASMLQTFSTIALAFVLAVTLGTLLGLGMAPLVVLGVLSAAPAVVISTLAGLDRVSPVMRKVARMQRLGRARTLWLIVLPAAMPGLFSGFKLALSYALIGVIAGEFILSGSGLGYAISFAYQSFDNRAMYGLMLFVLLVAVVANGLLYVWEGWLARRRAS